MKKILYYLNYKTYKYPSKYNDKYIIEDTEKIASVLIFIILSSSIILFPSFINNTLLNLFQLPYNTYIFYIISALIGLLICKLELSSLRYTLILKQISNIYTQLLMLFIALNIILNTDYIHAGLISILIIYLYKINIKHTNPILFTISILIPLFIFTPYLIEFYQSIQTIVIIYILAFILIYFVFYSNITVKNKLKNIITIETINNSLIKEIEEKNDIIIQAFKKHSEIQDNIIYAMADLVENRDADTGNHTKRTADYSKIIAMSAKKMNFYENELTLDFIILIEKAAPIHDIGKIMISDNILKIPRRLTEEEFEIMKTHAITGAKIIEHVYMDIESSEYIQCASNIAHYHHERWDGKGYPEGLEKENIPLEARIVAIADVFDALISKRCYKDSFSLSDAFMIIEKESGTHFDPKLVQAFLAAKDEIIEAVKKYQ